MMDFFEHISHKVAKAGREVSQQTKNMADIARMNSDISMEEKRILQTYREIGQAYYELHKNDSETEFSEKLEIISESVKKIEGLKEQIKGIKGLKKCPECGVDISSDALFCPSCGERVIRTSNPVSTDDMRVCPSCGSEIKERQRFCNYCGAPLR